MGVLPSGIHTTAQYTRGVKESLPKFDCIMKILQAMIVVQDSLPKRGWLTAIFS